MQIGLVQIRKFACNQFHMHILLLVTDNSLDLDDYVAEPFSIYATGESWECFSPGVDGLSEAIHCLCTHNTFFKMVPINDSFWKK